MPAWQIRASDVALRSLLTAAERSQILAVPTEAEDIASHYALREEDLSLIRQRRGDANRLGFAVQLCLLRHPGIALAEDTHVPVEVISWLASHLAVSSAAWDEYGTREETRQEHGREIRAYLGMSAFGIADFRQLVEHVVGVAAQTDKGLLLVEAARDFLQAKKVAMPGLSVIERASAQALTRANRNIYATLGGHLSLEHRKRLDGLLLPRPESSSTEIGWLRQAPLRANARAMNEHIDRLTTWRALDLPWAAGRRVHRNRLLKLAREGASMTAADLARFEPTRRYATLFAMVVESMATVTDEIIELHDRIIGRLIRTAQNKQNQATLASRSTVTAMMRLHSRLGDALFAAKENGEDPFAVIETAIGWESLAESIAQAKDRQLLLTAILADGINLGLTKMAESCTGVTYAQLDATRPRTSGTKPTVPHWRNWSTPNTATPLPHNGATGPPLPPMASASVPAAKPNPPGM